MDFRDGVGKFRALAISLGDSESLADFDEVSRDGVGSAQGADAYPISSADLGEVITFLNCVEDGFRLWLWLGFRLGFGFRLWLGCRLQLGCRLHHGNFCGRGFLFRDICPLFLLLGFSGWFAGFIPFFRLIDPVLNVVAPAIEWAGHGV